MLKVGEVAKRSGITVRTLHHYDNIGLLSPSMRAENGVRLYGDSDIACLHKIQTLKQIGFPLADIKLILSAPESPIDKIIAGQILNLEEQINSALALKERLLRLQKLVSTKSGPSLDDWLNALQLMTVYEKRLSKDEFQTLRKSFQPIELRQKQWHHVLETANELLGSGISPHCEQSKALAWEWIKLLRATTNNDLKLAEKLRCLHLEQGTGSASQRVNEAVLTFLTTALNSAWVSLLSKHLPLEQSEIAVRNFREQSRQWNNLVSQLHNHSHCDDAASQKAFQALAKEWALLFRQTFSEQDPGLEKSILNAFRKESDLLLISGMDLNLFEKIQAAIAAAPN